MSDDLRTRIAKALQGEADDGFTWEDWLPLADAVIRELGLRDEYLDSGKRRRTRVVSDWERNPE